MSKVKAFKHFTPNPNSYMGFQRNHPMWDYREDGEMVTVCCGESCELESDICSLCGCHSELTPKEDFEK